MMRSGTPSTPESNHWPALLDRRSNTTLRQRFAMAERVLRLNSPRESLQSACMFGLQRLQRLFPGVSRQTLANVIEAVVRARSRRARPLPAVPAVVRTAPKGGSGHR